MIEHEARELVDQLAQAAVETTDQTLQKMGFVQPPTAHLLLDEVDPPYLGYVTCRQFYRGEDAARAVAGLGAFGSMFGASRLVVAWEYRDLAAALEQPNAHAAPSGVVVLDATRTGHTVRWHPMRMHPGPVISGLQTVRAEWGETRQHNRGALPEPVDALLGFWRSPKTWTHGDIVESYETLIAGGYSMRWVDRDPETPQPGWMRLLHSKHH